MLSELSRREMYHRQHDANKVSYYKKSFACSVRTFIEMRNHRAQRKRLD